MKLMKSLGVILCCIGVVLSLLSCEKPHIERAAVTITPTEGYETSGTVLFEEIEEGIKVTVDLAGLSSGEHGFHVHEFGDISSSAGKAAGGHFNPGKHQHAGPTQSQRHMGDLGNLMADESGRVQKVFIDQHLSLNSDNSIIGRAVIVHAHADDLSSQPSGAAGPRVGQGVIGIAE